MIDKKIVLNYSNGLQVKKNGNNKKGCHNNATHTCNSSHARTHAHTHMVDSYCIIVVFLAIKFFCVMSIE